MNLRIEIWCEGDRIIARVPSDIQVINFDAITEILKRRKERIYYANKYRDEFNRQFKNEIELHIFGKKELKSKVAGMKVTGWSPIISQDALEFICGRF